MIKTMETKQCKKCNSNFKITDKDLEFYDKVSPIFNSEKYSIPTPTLCPDCRQQRRLSFRNERKLYKRKCDATGENIVSIYSPDKAYIVYNQDMWWSDKWSGLDYGKDFDFERSFFEQIDNLMKEVPRSSVINWLNENSYYCNHAWKQKNCYFSVDALENENCYYTNDIYSSSNCIDSWSIKSSEKISNSFMIIKSFNCSESTNLENCNNCYLSNYLTNCNNCLWSTNLVNWDYLVLNKKVTKEEFESILNKYKTDLEFKNNFILKFEELTYKTPKKDLYNINSINSKWNYLSNVENVTNSYFCYNSKDLKYCSFVIGSEDCYDYDVWWNNASRMYETHCAWGTWEWKISWASNILFSNIIWWWSNIYYSDTLLNNSNNCFGCVWLKNNESYCVLNKQYTKEEYNILVPKIIEHMKNTGEWWEFFSFNISPLCYNETTANEYFPLTKEEILEQWFKYSDYETPFPKVDKIIPASKLPENIVDIPDDILNWAVECEISWKPFRIIPQELEFYRKHNLPIPKKHPDIRHEERIKLRNPRKMFDRKCDKCDIDINTNYSPDRKGIVYCEECYNKEVY